MPEYSKIQLGLRQIEQECGLVWLDEGSQSNAESMLHELKGEGKRKRWGGGYRVSGMGVWALKPCRGRLG